jgi:hypothetical protein
MAEIQAGTIFAAIAPNTDVDKKSALINEKSLTYTIEDIAAAVSGDIDLSDYLTIEDAEETYQPKFDIASNSVLSVNASILSGAYTSVGGVDIASGKTSGTIYLQVDSPYTWFDNGTAYFFVNCNEVTSTSKILLTCISNANNQVGFASVHGQITGVFYISIRNMGFAIADGAVLGVNWAIIK